MLNSIHQYILLCIRKLEASIILHSSLIFLLGDAVLLGKEKFPVVLDPEKQNSSELQIITLKIFHFNELCYG